MLSSSASAQYGSFENLHGLLNHRLVAQWGEDRVRTLGVDDTVQGNGNAQGARWRPEIGSAFSVHVHVDDWKGGLLRQRSGRHEEWQGTQDQFHDKDRFLGLNQAAVLSRA